MNPDSNQTHEEVRRMLHGADMAPRPLSDLKRLLPHHAHEPAPVRNVNDMHAESMTVGQQIADSVATRMGSWPFIITQSTILAAWIALNVIGWIRHWDPYPFILLNLALSFQAAYAAPFIMMSQNRQASKDRLEAHNDYQINLRAEGEVTAILRHLDYQDALILQILTRLEHEAGKIEADRVGDPPSSSVPKPN